MNYKLHKKLQHYTILQRYWPPVYDDRTKEPNFQDVYIYIYSCICIYREKGNENVCQKLNYAHISRTK